MESHILGFPRIGATRGLKSALERHWRGEASAGELAATGQGLKMRHWSLQKDAGLSLVCTGDFSFYDHILDTTLMLGLIPERFRDGGAADTDLLFRLARGDATRNIPALDMSKWFDTNYHYIVPELNPASQPAPGPENITADASLAASLGYRVKAVLPGPVTYLSLARVSPGTDRWAILPAVLDIYAGLLRRLAPVCAWIEIDEPILGTDLDQAAREMFVRAGASLRAAAPQSRLLLGTFFAGLGTNLDLALASGFDALHLDLTRARNELDTVLARLPGNMALSAGMVDGRNIWKTDLNQALDLGKTLESRLGQQRLLLGSSCSLLHAPVDVEVETRLAPRIKSWMSFAVQKCREIAVLAEVLSGQDHSALLAENAACLASRRADAATSDPVVRQRVAAVSPEMLRRRGPFAVRKAAQAARLKLPLLPTTSIGSFPQTKEIRAARLARKRGETDQAAYEAFLKATMADVLARQEQLGLDVLAHGESERNDMVEYFGQMLSGFCFTDHGWVQSYGSRCVKPPVIHGDVSRPSAMTVAWITQAQALTAKPVKGMLTGPVTILNWSFVRDDLPRAEVCRQIALAVRDEVADLERAGVAIIQIDEAAFREGLPLSGEARAHYLTWAVECFRLASCVVRDDTQIHTHMCYSEFGPIMEAIVSMDADVISIESSRSGMELLDVFRRQAYPNDIGPGVYDIHSPRVPDTEEIQGLLRKALETIPAERLWVNPDCGLKTRDWPETMASLANMVAAAKALRAELSERA